MERTTGLAVRLRVETSDLHQRTEQQAGVPGRIDTVHDYVELLRSMLVFHLSTERALGDPRFSQSWDRFGVDISRHFRSHLLLEDLAALGTVPGESDLPEFEIATFAGALGCLYVVEGSSLGGRVIGPAIVQKLGALPTAYYDGDGRGHPGPWRSVQAALRAYESVGADQDGVVCGAVAAFSLFGNVVHPPVSVHEPV